MFVSHTGLYAQLTEVSCVFQKAGCHAFLDFTVVTCQHAFFIAVLVGAVVVRIFATERKRTAPQRAQDDQFTGKEIVTGAAEGGHVFLLCPSRSPGNGLCSEIVLLVPIPHAVQVEVDAPTVHLAIVIGIDIVCSVLFPNVNLCIRLFVHCSVHECFGQCLTVEVNLRVAGQLVADAHRMVGIELIVHGKDSRERMVNVLLSGHVVVYPPMVAGMDVYRGNGPLAIVIVSAREHPREVEPACAIVEVELVVQRFSKPMLETYQTVAETKTFALCLLGDDADDRFDRGIVTGTRIVDNFHGLDVV